VGEVFLIPEGLVVSDRFLADLVLHDVLLHHVVVELKRVFEGKAVLDLSTLRFDDERALRVNRVFDIVFLCSFHYILKLGFMPPACILLADETLRWRGMLALAAIKFTHNLIKFIHFQFSGFK
jgi:hypothetical protein